MLTKDEMLAMKNLALTLNSKKPEGNESLIFIAVGDQGKSCVTSIKGAGPAVAAALASVMQAFLTNHNAEGRKVLQSFFVDRILEV